MCTYLAKLIGTTPSFLLLQCFPCQGGGCCCVASYSGGWFGHWPWCFPIQAVQEIVTTQQHINCHFINRQNKIDGTLAYSC